MGEAILEDLEIACKLDHELETQRRLESLLQHARTAALLFETPERIAQWRAIEVLERIGNREAKQLLHALASGAPSAQQTHAARDALDRLSAPRRR